MATLLPISTRGAGMATVQLYQQLSTCEYFFDAVPPIYTVYRAVLGSLELKLAFVQRDYNNDLSEKNRQLQYKAEMNTDFKTIPTCPNSIGRLIDAVGFLEHETGSYVPAVHKRVFENNRYVPRTDNILISNLRETVVALSDPDTPLVYRKSFFRNNPIPGARFENNLLLNPDEIIPPDYTVTEEFLGKDMDEILPQVDEIQRHFNESSVRDNSYTDDGHECLLYINSQCDLAIPSHPEGLDKNVYYTQCLPTGNITEFWTKVALSDTPADEDTVNLLGELPNLKEFITPFYDIRNTLQDENPIMYYADYSEICRSLYLPYSEERARYGRTPSPGRDENGDIGEFRGSPFLL